MKLLIITQKVDKNDPVLGFFHNWLSKLASKFESITVICLQAGIYDLPSNVKVFSLGKENILNTQYKNNAFQKNYRVRNFYKLTFVFKFFRYIWHFRSEYDAVFVHMNPEYIVLGGLFWKMTKKKIVLWYTHRQRNLKLRIAEYFADMVLTSSKFSFTLSSHKVRVVGHGIDVDMFTSIGKKENINQQTLLHIGRITRIKNCHILIEALKILNSELGQSFDLKFIGDTIYQKDKVYKQYLVNLIEKYDLSRAVRFEGAVVPEVLPSFYSGAFATVNLAPSGGVDKSVLESFIAGTPCFVSNLAFEEVLLEYRNIFMFKENDSVDLARKILNYKNSSLENKSMITNNLKTKIAAEFSLSAIADKISEAIINL
jgi:glycosyltransferase involved in cell wall biosynthesis